MGIFESYEYADQELDINFKSYKSISDEWLKDNFENDYIFLYLMPFSEYYYLLLSEDMGKKDNISEEQIRTFSINSIDKLINNLMSKEKFSNFIYNTLFTHPLLKNQIKNEKYKTKCGQLLLYIYSCLKKNIYKYQYGSEYIPGSPNLITKLHLLGIGFLYCGGRNIEKLDFLFRIFSEHDELVRKNELSYKFFLSIFLICSQCLLYANNKMDIEDYEKFPIRYLNTVRITFSLINVEICINLFNNSFFEENDYYNYDDFIRIFREQEFDWIFSPSVIRDFLERNDEKEANNWREIIRNYTKRTIIRAINSHRLSVSLKDN